MGSREVVLGRIRSANGFAGTLVQARAEWDALPRGYRRTALHGREAMLDLLEDRLRDYDAVVVRAAPDEVRGVVAGLLGARGKRRIVVPQGFPEEFLPEGFSFGVDALAAPLSAGALDEFEGVLTGAVLAIAETGTIVLQTVAGQGRRAISLVPDYHLCLVRASSVVDTAPEAFDRLAGVFATTFISGPSATADIEMTRIKGVHGPRFLDVVLVMD
jgi:L-lactate dehydrogenase complex protein LldG